MATTLVKWYDDHSRQRHLQSSVYRLTIIFLVIIFSSNRIFNSSNNCLTIHPPFWRINIITITTSYFYDVDECTKLEHDHIIYNATTKSYNKTKQSDATMFIHTPLLKQVIQGQSIDYLLFIVYRVVLLLQTSYCCLLFNSKVLRSDITPQISSIIKIINDHNSTST